MVHELIGGDAGATAPASPPRAFLDAGGGEWAEMEPIVRRRMGELAAGEVLEVIEAQVSVTAGLRSWCGRNSLDVQATQVCGGKLSFRISKRLPVQRA